jgi:predicted helicase
MFVFPLFRYYEADGTIFQNSKLDLEPTLNMSQDYLDKLTAMGYCTNQNYGNIIFAFMYALLNSPIYRARYSIFLKTDFPHIPLPISLSLFNSLSALGGSLIRLHTLDSDCSFPIETQRRNSIETLLNNPVVKFLDSGFRDVAKGFPKYDSGTVFINPNDSGFKGVPEDVWNFHIGGYQVCEKWLKDRRGRTLSDEDIEHYQKIVVALKETIRLMGEIDKVIEEHGGFPDAFVTDPKVIEEAKAKAG